LAFYLFWPDKRELEELGFESVAHVPCVFDGNWQYDIEASQYLRDRALPDTFTANRSPLHLRAPRYPTIKSISTFGSAITNFLEWCEAKNLKWQELEFKDNLVDGYQSQMLSGAWSARNKGLSASTVNARVAEACRFLSWAASRNLRKPFKVDSNTRTINSNSGTSAIGHRPKLVQQRAGAVRPDPKTMRMPTDTEVAAWHRSVEIEHGTTKALICELVQKTAIRREEAAQWRVDTLPLIREQWNEMGDYVTVELKYGTKGPKHVGTGGELVGPARFITIPLELAVRIARYRDVRRPVLRARYVRAASNSQEKRERMSAAPKRLFLSDFHGQPVSAAAIYKAWTSVSRLPFRGWCPHQGRHYWSCKWMLDAVQKRFRLMESAKESGWTRAHVSATAMDVLMFEIKPQLGHVSKVTSERYIAWLLKATTLTNVSDAYEQSLDSMMLTNLDR
jgi:integrase